MNRINVDYNLLLDSANYIDQINEEYKRQYNELYTNVETLSTVWQGDDNIAFTNKIKEFYNDFNSMNILLSQYTTFLKNSANSYEQTQQELVNQSNRLS